MRGEVIAVLNRDRPIALGFGYLTITIFFYDNL